MSIVPRALYSGVPTVHDQATIVPSGSLEPLPSKLTGAPALGCVGPKVNAAAGGRFVVVPGPPPPGFPGPPGGPPPGPPGGPPPGGTWCVWRTVTGQRRTSPCAVCRANVHGPGSSSTSGEVTVSSTGTTTGSTGFARSSFALEVTV